jgi:miniconductance mechanosensitive channel
LQLLDHIDELKIWIDQYPWLDMLTSLFFVICAAIIANFIAKHIVIQSFQKITNKIIISNKRIYITKKLINRIANIVPAIVVMHGIATVPFLSPAVESFVQMIAQAFIFLSLALAISELLNIFNTVYQDNSHSKSKPIKGYLQLIKLIIFIVCILMIIGTFLQRDVFTLLASFGAMTAILMLVFQNTLLSIVASIQISSYDMVRIGDWITMPSLNADGDVIDMSLHTVTVQNFDKTYTTVPTNKLVTDTFINWRGMSNAGVRRIKRSLHIDQFSVHFIDEDTLNKLKGFLLLDQYLDTKSEELNQFNQHLTNPTEYNQRRLTNLGTFRAYVEFYLKQHPKISKNQTCMVRQLQPTSEGLPLEIYAFTNTTVWKEYEDIQSDIFDHLIAVLPEFGLKIYQEP